ncbi:methyltransferase domain-containing protein [Agromyces sp. C10]|uniref:methyltransferase domain-containing protein n=1 Tax=Agromyces sp. C10 TaxID=2935077 RepID=UPI00200A40F1|nr:methyltransferase domain-containing protein [Agromyces sp. C10]MCK8609388.1 methyltransferase domain-containing protein [Agromyces sp. C10]
MDECCGPSHPDGYDEVFDGRFAQRVARRYGARGLSRIERRLVEFLEDAGVRGATVLEIGGGVGEMQLELLARGATRTVNVELSNGYERDAERLLSEAGVADRVTRLVGLDVAVDPEAIEPADLVVLNRVVCCYPEAERLLTAAASRARRALVFSHPRRNWVIRSRVAIENRMHRRAQVDFRSYVHRPQAMREAVRRAGFEIRDERSGLAWCTVGAVRAL